MLKVRKEDKEKSIRYEDKDLYLSKMNTRGMKYISQDGITFYRTRFEYTKIDKIMIYFQQRIVENEKVTGIKNKDFIIFGSFSATKRSDGKEYEVKSLTFENNLIKIKI